MFVGGYTVFTLSVRLCVRPSVTFCFLISHGHLWNLIKPCIHIQIYIGPILEINQRTNGPLNAHLISGHTVSTKTIKIGQGQHMVIIYIIFVELESLLLHAKFQDHRTPGSGDEDF